MLSRGELEYHILDLAQGADISRPTCYKELSALKKKGIGVKGGKYRGKQLYKLNKDSKVVKAMLKSFHSLIYQK